MKELQEVKNKLSAVLCDPEGKCCIRGSYKDREKIEEALTELNTFIERLDSEELVAFDPSTLNHGLYKVYWSDGGASMAAVGSTYEGARWLAPTNWQSGKGNGFKVTTDWSNVVGVRSVLDSGDFDRDEYFKQPLKQ